MVSNNSSRFETAFCVSIEARERTTSGISAADRAATVLAAIDPATKPADLNRPGHIFPLRARNAGVLERTGQTEAAVDLARLAGLCPAGVICEIMNDDGAMARVPELREFALRHNILLITVADLIKYRLRTESVVKRAASTQLPTEYGEFRLHAFENQIDKQTHIALVCGDIGDGQDVLVRVHSQCLAGSTLMSAASHWRIVAPCSLTKLEICHWSFNPSEIDGHRYQGGTTKNLIASRRSSPMCPGSLSWNRAT
jgi:3,4-dihydroxy 2-butanone 4-phosphate synthase/GTP cyclohydrolase II